MADEDEDVIFENSPLEKYLKDTGFVDFEPESTKHNNELEDNVCRGSEGVRNSQEPRLRDKLRSFVGKLYSPDIDRSFQLRKEYISIIFSSGIVSEDYVGFLQQFDPELFDICNSDVKYGVISFNMLYNYVRSVSAWACGNVMAFLVLFTAVIVSNHYCIYLNSVLLPALFIIMGFVAYSLWKRQHIKWLHNQNVKILSDYVNKLKSFLMVFRKSILLIQELELISKGYTLVGFGLNLGSRHSDENYKTDIYPLLRQCLLKNGMELLQPSCLFVQDMALKSPLAPEVNSVFTYISGNPLREFGLDNYCDSEKLSLQYLKLLLLLIASQQSELLSRYLLGFSEIAKIESKTCLVTIKSLERMTLRFANQLNQVKGVLKSLQLSYHVHKSSLTFTGDEERTNEVRGHQVSANPEKWSRYYTSIHSLELHLKACLTRTQSVVSFLIPEMTEENKESLLEEQDITAKLEATNAGLKMELDSIISCLEECDSCLKKSNESDRPCSTNLEERSPDEGQIENLLQNNTDDKENTKEMGDCVFEAFTDISDYDESNTALLTREELEKESQSREESKHLLVELKNVLHTKTKDPMISEAGFVKPTKPPADENSMFENKLCKEYDWCKDKERFIGSYSKDYVNANIPLQSPGIIQKPEIKEGSVTDDAMPCPSKAFSSAIEAAAQRRGLVMEESYGSSDSE